MKFYLRGNFIHVLTSFTAAPACGKSQFGCKINIAYAVMA